MRFFGRSLTGLFLVALTLALLGLAGGIVADALRDRMTSGMAMPPPDERVIAATVMTITPGAVTPRLTAFGEVQARRTLDLRARQGGVVVWVSDRFRNGAAVEPGEALVRLDPVPATDALALARANADEAAAIQTEASAAVILAQDDLAAAEAQAGLRRQSLTRQQDLAARGAGSSQAVETAELAVSAADQAVLSRRQSLAATRARVDQAAVAVTRAAIALAEATRGLADTELRAEFGGLVDGAALVTGAMIGANEVLGRIIDPAALDVAMRLSSGQFSQMVQPDGRLWAGRVTVDLGDGSAATGRLDRVAASVGAGQTGRLVYVALDAVPGQRRMLQPGDFVTVTVDEAPLPDAALIPASALGRDGSVLATGPQDRLEQQPVTVLRRQGDAVIIEVGDLAGRQIVTDRSALLGAGIRIRPVRADLATSSAPQFAPEFGPEMITLTEARRADLIARVDADPAMPADAKDRLRQQLQAEAVPADLIAALERRKGG